MRVRAYWDSSVFLAPMLRNVDDGRVQACEERHRQLESGRLSVATATLTWDEVTWHAGRRLRPGVAFDRHMASRAGSALLAIPQLRWVAVDRDTVLTASRLLVAGAAPRNAIHVAAAIQCGATELVTLDGDFARLAASVELESLRVVCLGVDR